MFEVPKRVLCKHLLALPDNERSGQSFPLSILTPCLEVPNMDKIGHHTERKLVLYHISTENPAINHVVMEVTLAMYSYAKIQTFKLLQAIYVYIYV